MNTPEKPPVRPPAPRNPVPESMETPGTENEAHSDAQRVSINDLTSDQLDDLYDRMEAAEETYSTWQRRAQRSLARIEAARALHQPMQRGPQTICARCSGWDGRRVLGVLTDYPCATLRALGHPAQPNAGPTETPSGVSTASQTPVHAPGGYQPCHPQRADSPRAEPRSTAPN